MPGFKPIIAIENPRISRVQLSGGRRGARCQERRYPALAEPPNQILSAEIPAVGRYDRKTCRDRGLEYWQGIQNLVCGYAIGLSSRDAHSRNVKEPRAIFGHATR